MYKTLRRNLPVCAVAQINNNIVDANLVVRLLKIKTVNRFFPQKKNKQTTRFLNLQAIAVCVAPHKVANRESSNKTGVLCNEQKKTPAE